jgi:hypothetical protein
MVRIRTIGLALVAVFALTAVVASAASAAAPEFRIGPCHKVAKGTAGAYPSQSKCEERLSQNVEPREWEPDGVAAGEKIKFTSKSGAGKLVTVGGEEVKCTGDTDTGEITGPKTVGKVTVKFTGCEAFGFIKCNSVTPKGASGEIITKELEGQIGYSNEAKKEVGLDLWPSSRTAKEKEEHKFEALFVEFECTGFANSKVKGSLIGAATPTNTLSTTGTLTYVQTSGKQAITSLVGVEGGVKDVLMSSLNGGAFEEAGLTNTDTNTFEKAIELRA